MPVQVSAPIAVADSTAFVPTLTRCTKVAVKVVFYTNSGAALAQAVAIGSGTRTLTVSRIDDGGTTPGTMTSPITGASIADQPARTWKVLDVGPVSNGISIVASGGENPVGGTYYRIWVDAG